MIYKNLEKIYDELKKEEKENNDVNYISKLYILDYFKEYKEFEILSDETKKKLIDSVYYYWIQSYYSIEICEEMVKIVMTENEISFLIKLRNNKITSKDIAKLLKKNENMLNELMYL